MEEYELGVEALKKERSTLREELRRAKEKLVMMESVIKTVRAAGEGESVEDSPAYKHRMETLAKQVHTYRVTIHDGKNLLLTEIRLLTCRWQPWR